MKIERKINIYSCALRNLVKLLAVSVVCLLTAILLIVFIPILWLEKSKPILILDDLAEVIDKILYW